MDTSLRAARPRLDEEAIVAPHEVVGESHPKRLERGWVDVWRRDDGVWGVSWSPDGREPDYPGTTHTSEDDRLPAGFPRGFDPERLHAWAAERWAAPPASTADDQAA
jgi:hypothetical protein